MLPGWSVGWAEEVGDDWNEKTYAIAQTDRATVPRRIEKTNDRLRMKIRSQRWLEAGMIPAAEAAVLSAKLADCVSHVGLA